MKVVSINDHQKQKHKEEMLEVIEHLKSEIENDEITEFVAASVGSEGEVHIHVCVMDVPGGIGLFEIGKHLLISSEV